MTPAMARRAKALRNLLKDGRPKSALEIQCIERMLDDFRDAKAKGLEWDEDEAQLGVRFIGLLEHWKGQWAGQPLDLMPWQEHCVVAPLFGWWRTSGGKRLRRFSQSYIEVPRKNGKTTLAAGIALKCLVADREPGAEVYGAATKRDQALILVKDCAQVLGKLKGHVHVYGKRPISAISCPALQSTLTPLSSDYNTLDGLNVHCAVVDELHAHTHRGLYDVLLTGMGARTNPMLLAITTAGVDRSSICWELRELCRRIVERNEDNEGFHTFISTIDDGDDWQDPEVWRKANPSIGVSTTVEALRKVALASRTSGGAQNNFRRKHLNEWVGQAARWIDVERWDACAMSREEFDAITTKGLPCWLAIDLASVRDLNALACTWRDGQDYYTKAIYWAPINAIDERAESDRRMVKQWMDLGWIRGTPGDTANREIIAQDVFEVAQSVNLQALAFDPWHAEELLYHLRAYGFPESKLVQFRQVIGNYAPACKTYEELIYQGRLRHPGDPCMRWQVSNLAAAEDKNGNIRPDKENSADKIDGPVATIMTLGEAVHGESSTPYLGAMFLDW